MYLYRAINVNDLEDYDLYQIFNKLYNRIVNYLPFNADLTDYKFKYKEQ